MKAIPPAALQQHVAILGKTGSGKTFAAKGLVEGLLRENRRVGIVDPTGAWWGLRSSRDGKGAGFPILVLGGAHGDLPLTARGGAAVAGLLVEGVNLIADTSEFTVGERTTWFVDFASALYRRNAQPLHLVLDEAHNFAPQGKVHDPAAGKMLHAANTLASGGRSRGIRLMMITQRPQKLHKDTLTSADTLIAMRVLAPHDRAAVEDWIKGCGDGITGKQVLTSLASLQRGEGWIWYPEGKFLERTMFPAIATFDSSATPAENAVVSAPATAHIDLDAIRAALGDALKDAEANDPKALRAELERLRRAAPGISVADHKAELAAARAVAKREGIAEATLAMVGLVDGLRKLHSEIDAQAAAVGAFLAEYRVPVESNPAGWAAGERRIVGSAEWWAAAAAAPNVRTAAGQQAAASQAIHAAPIARHRAPAPAATLPHAVSPSAPPKRSISVPADPTRLPKAERLILTALAQYPQGRSKVQVAVLTGYAHGGGSFNNSLGALRSKGWIDGRGENLRVTDPGLAALGPFEPLPTGAALLDHWCGQLPKAERSILTVLAAVHPEQIGKVEIGQRAGYEAKGGAFNNALGRLRTLELIVGRGEIRLSDNLA